MVSIVSQGMHKTLGYPFNSCNIYHRSAVRWLDSEMKSDFQLYFAIILPNFDGRGVARSVPKAFPIPSIVSMG